MSDLRWNDYKCSLCGAIAHCQTIMYLQDNAPAPGMEHLCKACLESASLPGKTSVMVTKCAGPGCVRRAGARFEVAPVLREAGDEVEVHYCCGEHGWRWRERLGPEWEMTAVSVSVNAEEISSPRRVHRDDLQGATMFDATEQIN